MADHPAAVQVEVELLLRHLEDARAGLAEHALLAEAALALRVVGAAVDLRDRDLLLLHPDQERLAELRELAFLQFAERDVVPAGGQEQLELALVDPAESLHGAVEERDAAVGAEAGLLHQHAVEFEEQALLVGDLGHRGESRSRGSDRGARSFAPMASARSRPALKIRAKCPGRDVADSATGGSRKRRPGAGLGTAIRATELGRKSGLPHPGLRSERHTATLVASAVSRRASSVPQVHSPLLHLESAP